MHAQRPARHRNPMARLVSVLRFVPALASAWSLSALLLLAGPAAAGPAPKLLLLPIVVHSSEDPAYLREGLSDMLTARLDRIGAIEIVQPEPNATGTTELARAREAARRAGADYVLFGSFTRFGQGASLDVQCASADPSGRLEPLREIFVHSGSIGDIIPDLDELAGKVSRFARGEAVVSSSPSAAPGVGVSARDYQALLARVAALEQRLAELRTEQDGPQSAAASGADEP